MIASMTQSNSLSRQSLSFKFDRGQLSILDQTLLPHREEWMLLNSPEATIAAIKNLQVRGAPLIGITAAFSVAIEAIQGRSKNELLQIIEALRAARPTAVNLMVCLDRMKSQVNSDEDADQCLKLALSLFDEDQALCQAISQHGSHLIEDGDTILTHCNTGGLATAGSGTAIGIICEAHRQGKRIHVFVDETRPLLQGGRLTAWEMQKNKIPFTLITDNMAAMVMGQGKINKVIVGADRIALNGDFANKVGTYNLAIISRFHKVPMIVAAPYTTIDYKIADGRSIEIELRSPTEVRGVSGGFGQAQWAPSEAPVYNPAFDVTPATLTDYWVFDKGVLDAQGVASGAILKWKDN